MRDLDTLLLAIDAAVWELGEAMTDFPDQDLWIRPHKNLLSTGELLAHMIFGETSVFLGPDFKHQLIISNSEYYPENLSNPFELEITTAEFYAEIKTIHQVCKNEFAKLKPNSEDPHPYRNQWTWGTAMEYMAFHFAYHTGQIYSIRHILGHTTVDN